MPSRRDFLRAAAASGAGMLFGAPSLVRADSRLNGLSPKDFFRTGPMVGRVTDSSATLHLLTAENPPFPVVVRAFAWPADTSSGGQVVASAPVPAAGSLQPVEVPLSGLRPNRSYWYELAFTPADQPGAGVSIGPGGRFAAQKTPGEAFHFCVVSDGHWGEPAMTARNSPWRWTAQQCLKQVVGDGPYDFCVELGDGPLISGGTVSTPDQALERYLWYREQMRSVHRNMGNYFVLGNHEQEAGYFRRGTALPNIGPQHNNLLAHQHHQRWGTAARLRCIPNPLPDTYPQGGEGAPGFHTADEWGIGLDPWNDGPDEPIQNFYAWTWGDALFIVLDPFRYTLVDSLLRPTDPSQWTLGRTQVRWLKQTLEQSNERWKFILCHHVLGGYLLEDGRAYGRGTAIEAQRRDTEQSLIHDWMIEHGVQFFVYGHDHLFCHSSLDGVHYLCCGRPTHLNNWPALASMRGSYGDLMLGGMDKQWIRSLYNVLGYMRFTVTPDHVKVAWIRTGFSLRLNSPSIASATRDWRETWFGAVYPVAADGSIRVRMTPTDVDGVRTPEGAQPPALFTMPPGEDYYEQPDPQRPESYEEPLIHVDGYEDKLAAVDVVPEVVYEHAFE